MGKWGGRIGYVGNLKGCPYIHCNPPFVHSSRISTAFKPAASSQRCRAGGRATPGRSVQPPRRSKHHHHRHRCSRPPGPPTRGGKQPANWDEQAPPATTRSTTTTPPSASVRRAGHAAPGDVGHVARDKGYKAASLRRALFRRRLPVPASDPSTEQNGPRAGRGALRTQCLRYL